MDYIDQLIFETNSALAALEPDGALILPSTVMQSPPGDMVASPQGLRHTLRIVLAAAGAAVLLMGTAYAASVLGWIPKWNERQFWLSPEETPSVAATTSFTPTFDSLEDALAYYGAPENMVPSYIPDGYEFTDFECYIDAIGNICFFSWYSCEDTDFCISIDYVLYTTPDRSYYSKDDSPPEIYTFHGVEHHIMTNVGKYLAVWQRGDFECSFSGFNSREELIKTINSIYTEDIS